VSLAAVLAFVMGGHALLTQGLGPEFGSAYGLTLVLLLGQTINLVTGAVAVLLILLRDEAYVARVAVIAAVVVVGAELAASNFGVYGVAVASAAAVAIPNVAYSLRLRHVMGFAALPTARLATLRGGLHQLRGHRTSGREESRLLEHLAGRSRAPEEPGPAQIAGPGDRVTPRVPM
jgi:hypothetical protein